MRRFPDRTQYMLGLSASVGCTFRRYAICKYMLSGTVGIYIQPPWKPKRGQGAGALDVASPGPGRDADKL